jgi:P-loop containing NTP hydrolase pore-1/C-terminal domain on Strawberry notch homologue
MALLTQNITQSVIDCFHSILKDNRRLSQSVVLGIMTDNFGDSASGKWSWKQATDLAEGAFVKHLLSGEFNSLEQVKTLQSLVPYHTARSEEQIQYQQFSTPLELAWIVAQLASPKKTDVFLEPSAGTGILAATAINRLHQSSFSQTILNEISPKRKNLLQELFKERSMIFNHNAEYINDLLSLLIQPDLIIFNPPFSSSIGNDKRDRECCFRHLRSALLRLKTNGRLVGVLPHWLSPEKYKSFFESLPAQLQLSLYVSGNHYKYHGTTMPTRILVFDKIVSGELPKSIDLPTQTSGQLQQLAANSCPQRTTVSNEYVTVNRSIATAIQSEVNDVTLNLFDGLPLFQTTASKQLDIFYIPLEKKSATIAEPIIPTVKHEQFANLIQLSYRSRVKPAVPMTDEVYTDYQGGIEIEGASSHPSKICESISMAAIDCPLPVIRPTLPANILTDKLASDCQIETLIYACQSHNKRLDTPWYVAENGQIKVTTENDPEGKYHRQGYYCGFNTGVGKSRLISLLILTNWCEGRKKAVWVTKNDGKLLEDARGEWVSVGGRSSQIVPLSKFAANKPIILSEGILLVTYATLRSQAKASNKSRVDQIIEWLGDDWDGALCFDEAHLMSNACAEKGARGIKKASSQALAGTSLANHLPNSRVTYFSATGATSVSNLSYCQKLGLWQTQAFPFSSRADFISTISNAGIAGLEMIAKDLKSVGLYLAPGLSFAGVSFETMTHKITAEQREIWDLYAQAFSFIHQQLGDVLRAINVETESGQCLNSQARTNAMSMFEGTKLRFFNTLICAIKTPTLIESIEQDIASGYAPVVQLVSTGEATMNRSMANIPAHEWDDMRVVDFTPKEAILDYLMSAFPIHLYQHTQDEQGNAKSVLMRDVDGNPIVSQEALAQRTDIYDRICMLPPINGMLDSLVWHFGNRLSEVTGRAKRIVVNNKRYQSEKRSKYSSIADANAFQNGKTEVLVFSNSGGTGVGYHADLKRENQKMRVHYFAESGWTATEAIQGLGRTHRASQAQPPKVILLTTDIKGETRFLATIGARLASLGAITRGQRNTGSNLFDEESSNFTSNYAQLAMGELFQDLYSGCIDGITIGEFCRLSGLQLVNKTGALSLANLPKMNTFLNRLLSLPIDLQNILFTEFEDRMNSRIQAAKDNNTYDRGVENLHSNGGFEIIDSQVLNVHISNAKTICHTIDKLEPYKITTVIDAKQLVANKDYKCYRHRKTGELALAGAIYSRLDHRLQPVGTILFTRPSNKQKWHTEDLIFFNKNWEASLLDNYWDQWQTEIDSVQPHWRTRLYLISGLLLPIWKKLPKCSRVFRLQANNGTTLLGRHVAAEDIEGVYRNFGFNQQFQMTSGDILASVWGKGQTQEVGVYQIQRKHYKGVNRLEIVGIYGQDNIDRLKAIGCFTENINSRVRVFIPVDNATEIIEKLGKI